MIYDDFIQSLQHKRYPDEDYYLLIVYFKTNILLDIAKANQGIIARKLGLNLTKFSFILRILKLDIQIAEPTLSTLKATYGLEGTSK